jgi:phosphoribosylformylglycinamidine cyclo-ligase
MTSKITYQSSGVDIDKANIFIKGIGRLVKGTHTPPVILREGSFGGLFEFASARYRQPVLVSSTDGVGTKLLIAQQFGIHHTVGIDLVAMNVNDVLCTGAKPLFFLDYIACGRLDPQVLHQVVKGITKGCQLAGCALVGGETAEMPGMYDPQEYDLAGFTVGVVEKKKIVDGSGIRPGDWVLGLPSSGLHSNGFSLVRKVLTEDQQKTAVQTLLKPTRIYVQEVLKVLERFAVQGMAHITGGAYYEKLTKILPVGLCFRIDRESWPVLNVFKKIQKQGKINPSEMYRTFNMGIGFVLVVRPREAGLIQAFLAAQGHASYHIGEVVKDQKTKVIFSP